MVKSGQAAELRQRNCGDLLEADDTQHAIDEIRCGTKGTDVKIQVFREQYRHNGMAKSTSSY
jgi:hypothetical protein